jgi:hypothetical protein
MAIKTTKKFIEDSVEVYGNKYDYSESEYTGVMKPIKIICAIHGVFNQSPNAHLNGHGCKSCGVEKRVAESRSNTSTFILKAVEIHGDLFDYSLVEYKNNSTKVKIICKEHGVFEQTPAGHLAGRGCSRCHFDNVGKSKRSNKEDFASNSQIPHGNFYDYSEVVYLNNSTKVKIICPNHGAFWQQPNNHLQGKGCPQCADTGYQGNLPGYLYTMTCGDMTKIGITNLSPEQRRKDISRSCGSSFSVADSWYFEDGSFPDDLETMLLRELRKEYSSPSTKFDGSSECFLDVDYNKLVSRISDCIAEH